MRTAYKCRAYPDPMQASVLNRTSAASAWSGTVPGPDPLPAAGQVAGVDLGVKDFAVTSDGQRIANPRHLDRRARNLARYQRRLARCQPGSANRAKARAKAARAQRKVRAARTDFLHKASTGLVRGHDVIVLEDLVTGITMPRRTSWRQVLP